MEYAKEIRDLFLMQQIYATLFSATNKLQTQGDNQLEKLTSRQYMIMLAIVHLPEEESTLINIANKLDTSKQSAKKMIGNLEKKGFLVSLPSKKDKRAINVIITEAGMRVMLECGEAATLLMADIFSDFNTEELEVLWKLLRKLYSVEAIKELSLEEDVNYKFEKLDGFKEAQNRALLSFISRRKLSNN